MSEPTNVENENEKIIQAEDKQNNDTPKNNSDNIEGGIQEVFGKF